MDSRLDYLITALDFYLTGGESPIDAWRLALEAYAYVCHTDDGRSETSRSAEVVLRYLEEKDAD